MKFNRFLAIVSALLILAGGLGCNGDDDGSGSMIDQDKGSSSKVTSRKGNDAGADESGGDDPSASGGDDGASSDDEGAGSGSAGSSAGESGRGESGRGGSGGSSGSAAGSSGTTAAPDTKGVGKPCETSSDCPSGLTCRIDTTDYIAHRQCTAPCTSAEACQVPFGELTMCIGAEICVARCLTDADCPAQTICSDNDWCERTGPGSGNPYCVGSPLPCSTLSDSQCLGTLGCRREGDCTGVSTSCFSEFSSFACTDQDGCFWSSSSESCTGSATSCILESSETSCIFQDGCSWSASCTGTPLADDCSDQSISLCTLTAGCSVVNP